MSSSTAEAMDAGPQATSAIGEETRLAHGIDRMAIRLGSVASHSASSVMTAAVIAAAVFAAAEVSARPRTDAMDWMHARGGHVTEVSACVAMEVVVPSAVPEAAVIRPTAVVERSIEVVVETVAARQGHGTDIARTVTSADIVSIAAAEKSARRRGQAEDLECLHGRPLLVMCGPPNA